MTTPARRTRATRFAVAIGALATLWTCTSRNPLLPPAGDSLAVGTWGGDNAGVIVGDTSTHVHVGCTYGDVSGQIPLDSLGRFVAAGSYLLRAYPVAVGPTMPAQFSGRVTAATLTLTVTVSDTVAHATVVLGPVTVVFGKDPSMGPCPICRTPMEQAAKARALRERTPSA